MKKSKTLLKYTIKIPAIFLHIFINLWNVSILQRERFNLESASNYIIWKKEILPLFFLI